MPMLKARRSAQLSWPWGGAASGGRGGRQLEVRSGFPYPYRAATERWSPVTLGSELPPWHVRV